MLDLAKPVESLSGVGPRYRALLKKLGIETLQDLVYHFPFRYDDYSTVKPIAELLEGESVTFEAKVTRVDNIFTRYGKKLTKAVVADLTGKLDLIWFNQHYIKKQLEVG